MIKLQWIEHKITHSLKSNPEGYYIMRDVSYYGPSLIKRIKWIPQFKGKNLSTATDKRTAKRVCQNHYSQEVIL